MITHPGVIRYLNGYYKPISKELEILRSLGEETKVPIILRETEEFLKSVLGISKPKRILEIGTAIGYSALFFATMCSDAEVFTIEKNEKTFRTAKEYFEKIKLGNRVRLLEGDAVKVINDMADYGEKPMDLIFIDGSKSHYLEFFQAALKLSDKGTVIVSDNILMKGMVSDENIDKRHKTSIKRMREYVNFLNFFQGGDTSFLSAGDGIAITLID